MRVCQLVNCEQIINKGGQTFRPPALFVLADEVLHLINRLGNVGVFPHRNFPLVGNLAVNKDAHGDAKRRNVFQPDAIGAADAPVVIQVNGEPAVADVADKPVRGKATNIGHAETLRHAGERAGAKIGNVFHDCTPCDID